MSDFWTVRGIKELAMSTFTWRDHTQHLRTFIFHTSRSILNHSSHFLGLLVPQKPRDHNHEEKHNLHKKYKSPPSWNHHLELWLHSLTLLGFFRNFTLKFVAHQEKNNLYLHHNFLIHHNYRRIGTYGLHHNSSWEIIMIDQLHQMLMIIIEFKNEFYLTLACFQTMIPIHLIISK